MNDHLRLVKLSHPRLRVKGAWLAFAVLVLGCTAVSSQEKARVMDKIFNDGRETSQDDGEMPERNENEMGSSEPEPKVEPSTAQSEPTVQKDGSAAEPAKAEPTPARPRSNPQSVARLPLPRGIQHSDLVQFINIHADVLAPYQPFAKEWNYFARTFADGASANELELKTMRSRIREDFARAHWLFVWGLHQSSLMLLGKNKNGRILLDRQESFLGKMSVLVFLATELQVVSGRPEYREVLKRFYKNANAKYFKRPLTDRPSKPQSLLQPELEALPETKNQAPTVGSD